MRHACAGFGRGGNGDCHGGVIPLGLAGAVCTDRAAAHHPKRRMRSFDLAIVGAGILGLAHALAAARRGKRVVVIDRDAQANGASIRNFGFVTVTGQERGQTWRRAMRSRDVWTEVAAAAGVAIEQ